MCERSDFRDLCVLFLVKRFVLGVRVGRVRIMVMIWLVVANVRSDRGGSARLRVRRLVHRLCEKQLHLRERQREATRERETDKRGGKEKKKGESTRGEKRKEKKKQEKGDRETKERSECSGTGP